MVFGGSANVELLAAIKRHGGRGVGLSGVDGDLVSVTRRPPVRVIDPALGGEQWVDFGHVGDVASVDVSLLRLLLEAGYVPVVASLAADTEGRIYNVNADTIATALAVGLDAEGLLLVTNVPGILRDPNDRSSLVVVCTPEEVARMVEDGTISGGMLPKVSNCLEALRAGVKRVRILDGTGGRSLLLESFVREDVGTTIVK
jgi:acetylglutamate kinase